MKFSFEFIIDPANKLLICEVFGVTSEVIELEHMLKSIVKMAGENQLQRIVLDSTKLNILCSSQQIAKLMISIQENDLIGNMRIASIVNFELNINNLIEGMAEKLSLSIKNFATRSEDMLWLLFDKERD
jgi:hypothetical protein